MPSMRKQAVVAVLSLYIVICQSFIIPSSTVRKTELMSSGSGYSQMLKRRNVQIPLLDLQNDDSVIIPLPASHLPNELATLQIYGMQINAAIHKMMITDTLSKVQLPSPGDFMSARDEPTYGHIVSKPDDGSLVGAIGCAAEIVVATPSEVMQIESVDGNLEPVIGQSEDGNGSGEEPMTLLAKGAFRFEVKEVVQTFPFPIAIVDELLDGEPAKSPPKEYNDFEDTYDNMDDDDDDDVDDDMYMDIDASDLVPRCLAAMKAIVDQKISTKPKALSPLEESILKDSGANVNMNQINAERDQAEEMAAVFDIFTSSLLDIAPDKIERMYVVGMMTAEFAGLDNTVRQKIVTMVDGVARLRLVLEEAEKKISLVQAKKITEEIVDQSDEHSKDLKVGTPSLPPWAKSIKKGTKIEYFWSEIDGWCKGKVVEDPVMIVDEMIVTVLFDDGETHKLPFQGDEKVRWRPGGMK